MKDKAIFAAIVLVDALLLICVSIAIFVLVGAAGYIYADDYQDGYQAGYNADTCSQCYEPAAPTAPYPPAGEDTYADGFKAGQEDSE